MSTESKLLENLREAHVALLTDLQGLEWMASAPTGTSGEELCNRLQALRADVAEHFILEEQDGYLNPAVTMEPTARRKARELLGEHSSLLQSLDLLIQQAAKEGRRNTKLWQSVKHWIDRMREHEGRENEFFDEARDDDPCCRRD